MEYKFDLVIIGAGPGGYEAAVCAAKKGMRTAIIEKRKLGGTCLNRGCIPMKTLLHAAKQYHSVKECCEWGIQADSIDYCLETMQSKKNETIEQIKNGMAFILRKNKVKYYHGKGVIEDAHTVSVGEEKLTAESLLIAVGSVTTLPDIPGIELPEVVNSDMLLEKSDRIYPRLLIIGGGVIGMEFEQFYRSLGGKVTILEKQEELLWEMDKDIRKSITRNLRKNGTEIYTGVQIQQIKKDGSLLSCTFFQEGQLKEVKADGILNAAGRRTSLDGLFGNDMKISLKEGNIQVNENFQTSCENIYAIGDVTGGKRLAHLASAQGINAVCHMKGEPMMKSLHIVPECVYTTPEIAAAGFTSEKAAKSGIKTKTIKYPMTSNGKAMLSEQTDGFLKFILEVDTHQILGAHLMCEHATELIGQIIMAMNNHLTAAQIASVILPHPSFSEGIMEALKPD